MEKECLDFLSVNDEDIIAERGKIGERLPRCAQCGYPIWENECYLIDDSFWCSECVNQRKVWTQDHMKGE